MCNLALPICQTINTMTDDYTRLLEAARELRQWDTPAEVARGLSAGGFTVSDQIMTNWKGRGISSIGILEACRIIGCRTEYIRSGRLPMKDSGTTGQFGDLATRAAEIIDAMLPSDQQKLLHYLQVAKDQKRLQSK